MAEWVPLFLPCRFGWSLVEVTGNIIGWGQGPHYIHADLKVSSLARFEGCQQGPLLKIVFPSSVLVPEISAPDVLFALPSPF